MTPCCTCCCTRSSRSARRSAPAATRPALPGRAAAAERRPRNARSFAPRRSGWCRMARRPVTLSRSLSRTLLAPPRNGHHACSRVRPRLAGYTERSSEPRSSPPAEPPHAVGPLAAVPGKSWKTAWRNGNLRRDQPQRLGAGESAAGDPQRRRRRRRNFINFNIPSLTGGPVAILGLVSAAPPTLTGPVTIAGDAQPGFRPGCRWSS